MNCRLKACTWRATEDQLTCNNFSSCLTPSQYKPFVLVSQGDGRSMLMVNRFPNIAYHSNSSFKRRKKNNTNQNQTTLLLLNFVVNRNNIIWGFYIKAKRMDVIKYNTAKFEK